MRKCEKEYIKSLGYEIIENGFNLNTYDEIASHVDIYYVKVGDMVFSAPEKKGLVPFTTVSCTTPIGDKYPTDIPYNVCVVGNNAFHNFKYTDNIVKFYFNPHCITTYQFDPNLKFKLNSVGNNKHINDDGNQEPLELNHYRNKTFAERFQRSYKKSIADGNIEITKSNSNIETFTKDFLFYNRNNILNTTALDFKLK